MARLRTYGIRHHGPGSARAVLRALERDPPDALAVEMPSDFASSLDCRCRPSLRAPVALVAYAPVDVQQALYYPLASFSPEWVAMRWAAERGIPIVPVDLPAGLMIAMSGDQTRKHRLRVDPLGELAKLAGYEDRERWWEKTLRARGPRRRGFPGGHVHDRSVARGLPRSYGRGMPVARDAHGA